MAGLIAEVLLVVFFVGITLCNRLNIAALVFDS